MKIIDLIPGDPNYSLSDDFGDEKFELRILWSMEVETFFIDIVGLTNDFSITGKALTVGVDLLGSYRTPYGSLILIGDPYVTPTLATLGDTHQLVWLSPEEAAAL